MHMYGPQRNTFFNSITDQLLVVSSWLIRGNYFHPFPWGLLTLTVFYWHSVSSLYPLCRDYICPDKHFQGKKTRHHYHHAEVRVCLSLSLSLWCCVMLIWVHAYCVNIKPIAHDAWAHIKHTCTHIVVLVVINFSFNSTLCTFCG